MNENSDSGYAQVNAINLYYEVHGSGEPLILLHGGVGEISMFGEVLTLLAAGRQVIGVDLQAHGRTADIERPMTFEDMADDIGALIQYLGFKKADLMGYSLGGGVALQTAIRYPGRVRKLVLVSTPYKRDGWYPEVTVGMSQMDLPSAAEPMKQSPMYAIYSKVAPRVEDWKVLLAKLSSLLRKDYDWSKDIPSIQSPTLIVVGDADSVRPAHAVEFFELLGGGKKDAGWDGSGMSNSRLAVLPGRTHYNIFSSPAVAAAVIPFLDETKGEDTIHREIVATRVYNVPREVAFEVWTDPKHISQWWGPEGFTTTVHEMNVKNGGVWLFTMHSPDGTNYPNRVSYLEVNKPERLVYQHGEVGRPDYFQATVTFTDQGNQTELSMQMLFDTAEARNQAAGKYGAVKGLNQNLDKLGEYLSKMR